MSRLSDLMLRIRDSLADEVADRWTDARLLRLVSDGQRSIALQSDILRSSVVVPLVIGQSSYTLPDDCRLITRIESSGGQELSLLTFSEAERSFENAWQIEQGIPANIVYDQQQPRFITVVPVPEYAGLSLTVRYRKIPVEITKLTEELETPQEFDPALKHYVTGMAWRDSRDTQNRELANEELNFYVTELRQAIKHSKNDFMTSQHQHRLSYTTGFGVHSHLEQEH